MGHASSPHCSRHSPCCHNSQPIELPPMPLYGLHTAWIMPSGSRWLGVVQALPLTLTLATYGLQAAKVHLCEARFVRLRLPALARLIETANAPIFGVDLHGKITEWNRKAADMLGYTKQETMGKHLVQNFIQPENRDSVKHILSRAMAGEEAANFALPLLSKSQRRLTVLLNATTRRDANGLAIGVVGVGQDPASDPRRRQHVRSCLRYCSDSRRRVPRHHMADSHTARTALFERPSETALFGNGLGLKRLLHSNAPAKPSENDSCASWQHAGCRTPRCAWQHGEGTNVSHIAGPRAPG